MRGGEGRGSKIKLVVVEFEQTDTIDHFVLLVHAFLLRDGEKYSSQ